MGTQWLLEENNCRFNISEPSSWVKFVIWTGVGGVARMLGMRKTLFTPRVNSIQAMECAQACEPDTRLEWVGKESVCWIACLARR